MAKSLVAYFSVGGTTAKLARRLAQAIGADEHRIEPEQPYTQVDIDWTNKKSRSTVEMADESSRPAIAGKAPDLAACDTIYLGFPIWWYREPSIIDTFLESESFAGKTIVPFATSGSSDFGDKAGARIAQLAPGATVRPGKRFAADASADELKAWAQA